MNLGNLLLYFSLFVSLIVIALHVYDLLLGKKTIFFSRKFYYLSSITIGISFLGLLWAFTNNQYQYLYVYNNSSNDLNFFYLIAASWAGKSGSFLLWVFFLNIVGLLVLSQKNDSENILMLILTIVQFFLLFILLIDSPFKYIWEEFPQNFKPGFAPEDGSGLNPLLADPWMVFHPPFLFLGYASTTPLFGYALLKLIKPDYKPWVDKIYFWTIFVFLTLGIGIALGAYWAYTVLGWGGYWGWDPVENSSLIPWLIIVALLHGLIIQRRKKSLGKINLILAISSFILVLYSTFLTRSGILSDFSVHSFSDHGVGEYLVFFILFSLMISLLVFMLNFRKIKSEVLPSKILNWENFTSYGVLALVLFTIIVLTGTSMPILTKFLFPEPAAVTENFYNTISIPFGALILLLLIAINFFNFSWQSSLKKKIIISIIFFLVALLFSFLINFKYTTEIPAYLFCFLSFFIILQISSDFYSHKKTKLINYIPQLTHLGVALLVLGVITSNFYTTNFNQTLKINNPQKVGPFTLTFKGLTDSIKSEAQFEIKENDQKKIISTAYFFDPKTESLFREPYIESNLIEDYYLIPDNYQEEEQAVEKIILPQNKKVKFKNLNLSFKKFRTEQMTSDNPTIFADIMLNGELISLGIKVKTESYLKYPLPKNKKYLFLDSFDIQGKKISVGLIDEEKKLLSPAKIKVQIVQKKFISLVWLGMILIILGGLYRLLNFANQNK